MERPVYYIKGVVQEKNQDAGDFVGPLDLILHLLRKHKIAIRDIPLADLLEQYLAWMSARQAMDLEVAGEFIEMASHLMLLKTKMLLKEEDQEALSEMEELKVNLGQSVSYRKNVTATDDRDGEITFSIDSSAVNLEEEGTYTIVYTATDSSGNTTTVERKIHVMSTLVVNQELVDEMAKEILAKIITEDMTPH